MSKLSLLAGKSLQIVNSENKRTIHDSLQQPTPQSPTCGLPAWSSDNNSTEGIDCGAVTEIEQTREHSADAENAADGNKVYRCTICNEDLAGLHYLHRVAHVKSCMAGRNCSNKPKDQDTRPLQQQNNITIQEWLMQLGLDQYITNFLREEVDMSVVHALTTADLAEIGVAKLSHQRKILDAIKRLGGHSKKHGFISKGSAYKPDIHEDRIPIMKMLGTARARAEKVLLGSLYPECNDASKEEPICTPPLAVSAIAAGQRVQGDSSLWRGAMEYKKIAPSLETRLSKRPFSEEQRQQEVLARGVAGLGPKITQDSREAKLQKIEALKEEIDSHQQTIRDMEKMVLQLERELRDHTR